MEFIAPDEPEATGIDGYRARGDAMVGRNTMIEVCDDGITQKRGGLRAAQKA